MIGQTIDRYRVVEQLGKGGMGVVYKARDTVLERFVAIKVLPPDKSSDPERRRRFLKEAKAASGLNHSGIVAVHDVLTIDGQDILVMEFVEGETLEELLLRKRLPLSEALGLGIGIADALARAHAAGIVHRDLKPSNVMVTADGTKLLDFGLAKQVEPTLVDPEGPTLAPEESDLTRERAILGTVGWMSPEQAEGERLDARSDIFSFGVVMYEMLTGRHPFRRGSTIETLAAIREVDPERPTQLVPALPQEAERAILRCLRKNPAKRWQNASDLAVVLEDLREDTESGRRAIGATAAPKNRHIALPFLAAAAAFVVLAALIVGWIVLRPGRSAPGPLKLERLTYDAGMSALPAISSDGNLVAFISDRAGENNLDLWVRHIAQPEPVRLTRHPADELHPRFSPDGSRIVFRSDRDGSGLYVVNALGGGLHKVAGRGLFPMFTPDGRDIVFTEDPMWLRAGGLLRMFRVPAAGGPPSPFLPDWGVYRPPGSAGPVFSPDGRLVLFNGAPLDDPSQRDWWVVPVEGGEPWSSRASGEIRAIDVVQFPTAWYRDRLILAAGTTIEGLNLYSAKISDDGLISGPITPLTAGPGMSWRPSVSDAGRVALSRFSWVIHLWEVSLDPETGEGIGAPRRITDDAAPKFSFSLSRDGNLLAYSAYAGPRGNRQAEVVLVDRESGNRTVPVTLAEDRSSTSTYPRLSGDGSLLGWSSFEQGRRVAWTGPVDEPVGRELCRDCRIVDFFDGGRQVLVHRFGRGLSRIVRNDGDEEPVLETGERALLDADLSPDARWLAVKLGHPDDTVSIAIVSRGEVVAPADDWIHVAGGDRWVGSPRWSADGAILYFLTDRDDHICVWGQRIDPATKRPVGEAFPVVHAHGSNMNTLSMSRFMWNLEVGDDRLVFNAGELTGDVYTAMLE